ncbi:MAG: hypothetical protein ABW076_11195 [Candidatus Thiodiazotropha sp.]
MTSKDCFPLAWLLAACLATAPGLAGARNCSKGKPCGNGCIAQNKQCRIDNHQHSTGSPTVRWTHDPGVLRRTRLKLPRVYRVVSESATAWQAPSSSVKTARYRQGQSVFVYETDGDWARVSNMSPAEWLERKHLQLK